MNEQSLPVGNEPKCEDVYILHDSLFKDITIGLMKNENLTVETTSKIRIILQIIF